MDISVYIGELLITHDCVIIPGFGGFICNYKPAVIDSGANTISPPSKAISFNKSLKSNDGLLVNHISGSLGISFEAAYHGVSTWVNSSKSLLRSDEVTLRNVGKFFNDEEENLQFVPDGSVNYLRSSFGLKTITAVPIQRGLEVSLNREKEEQKSIPRRSRGMWRVAAVILLLISMTATLQLMWLGIEIKPLRLNEANVLSFVGSLFKTEEHDVKPIPVLISSGTEKVVAEQKAVIDSASAIQNSLANNSSSPVPGVKAEDPVEVNKGPLYYVIIGAFSDEKNIAAAKNNLTQKFPESVILVRKNSALTRLGYSVGSDPTKAKEQLKAAQTENASYWLLKE